jgi:universal stress protein A
MDKYKHILLAADYSGSSGIVARKAKALADIYQAKLSIVHTLDDIPLPDTSYGTVIPLDGESSEESLQTAKQQLLKMADELGVEQRNCWLIWGSPNDEIVRIAGKHQVDLIVTGSHGRHGLALIMGSTANSVLHHAECDVLAVRIQDS